MKAIKYLSILAISFLAASCMNEFDDPQFNEPPFGNNEIGTANITIAELKAKYASIINSGVEEIKNNIIIEGVEITEADGTATWAPEELQNSSNVVERHIKMGKTNLVLRMSTYADFANEVMPTGKLNINGVMTRYNNYWQFVISSTSDIETSGN